MTLRLRICSSFLYAVSLFGASVTGEVRLQGSRDPAVRKAHDYSGVVVWLKPLRTSLPGAAPKRVQMVQKNKRFTPHVLPIEVGSTVDFPNSDPIFHNAFSSFDGQIFDIGLYAPGTNRSIRFQRPGIVRVFCNIHPTMSAVIVVLGTPYFSATEKTGKFTIGNVASAEYELSVFHERARDEELGALRRRITVPEEGINLDTITISEIGYLLLPHKNKYGKDYPPAPDDNVMYPRTLR